MESHGGGARNLREQIQKIQGLTGSHFGVNIPLDLDQSRVLIDMLLREKVRIVITAAGSPAYYTELLGMKFKENSTEEVFILWNIRRLYLKKRIV